MAGFKQVFTSTSLLAVICTTALPATVNAEPFFDVRINASLRNFDAEDFRVYSTFFSGNPNFGPAVVDRNSNMPTSIEDATELSFVGLDGQDIPQTMSVNFDSRSSAGYDGLKIQSTLSVENPLFNPSNDPFVLDNSNSTDPNGVPTRFGSSAQAQIVDTVALNAAPEAATIRLKLNLDGVMSFDADPFLDVSSRISVQQFGVGDVTLYDQTVREDTAIDVEILTDPLTIDDGEITFNLFSSVGSDIQLNPTFPTTPLLPVTYSNMAVIDGDFFSTLAITELLAFDINGDPVDLISATGSDGFQYNARRIDTNPPIGVSEPTTIALLGFALSGLAIIRRRRHLSV